ncbi:hypothetical protein ACF1AE_21510 [Streptomyces sp. NPDC014986]|uniref:hypothetical protein n=1 Tax=Streptomyces sp. NPDC014986 TaxID=3364934 RepID=UPI0036F8923E
MTDPSTVTELRWNKDVFPPAGTDDNTSWIACTTSDGQPAALAIGDQEREALGRQLLYLDGDETPRGAFFEPERLYRTCSERGYERAPHTPAAGCTVGR